MKRLIYSEKLQMYQKLRLLNYKIEGMAAELEVYHDHSIELNSRLLRQMVRKFDEFKIIKFEIVDNNITIKSTKPSGESMTMSLRCDGEVGNHREVDVAQYILCKIFLYIRSDQIAMQLRDADHPMIITTKFGSNRLLIVYHRKTLA